MTSSRSAARAEGQVGAVPALPAPAVPARRRGQGGASTRRSSGATRSSTCSRRARRARYRPQPQLFTVLGPPGVGKSRLVQELIAGLADDGAVLMGRCLSYGEGSPLAGGRGRPQAAGIADTRPARRSPREDRRALRRAPDGDGSRGSSQVFGWARRRARRGGVLGRPQAASNTSPRRPLVVVFDDIHWAEPALLDLVEHLADRRGTPRSCCSASPARSCATPARLGRWEGERDPIQLEPLAADEAAALVDNLLDARAPAGRARPDRRGGRGNPLFVEEMLAMLVDDGLLRSNGAWVGGGPRRPSRSPRRSRRLLAARLDRLDPDERPFWSARRWSARSSSGAVATLAPEPSAPGVGLALLALVRQELIRPDRSERGRDAFRFRHLLIRDAAYEAMPKEERAELHEPSPTGSSSGAASGSPSTRRSSVPPGAGVPLPGGARRRRDDRAIELGRRAGRHLFACAQRADERERPPRARRGFLERRDRARPRRSGTTARDRAAVPGPRRACRLPGRARHRRSERSRWPRNSETGRRRSGQRSSWSMSRGLVEPSHSFAMSIGGGGRGPRRSASASATPPSPIERSSLLREADCSSSARPLGRSSSSTS